MMSSQWERHHSGKTNGPNTVQTSNHSSIWVSNGICFLLICSQLDSTAALEKVFEFQGSGPWFSIVGAPTGQTVDRTVVAMRPVSKWQDLSARARPRPNHFGGHKCGSQFVRDHYCLEAFSGISRCLGLFTNNKQLMKLSRFFLRILLTIKLA